MWSGRRRTILTLHQLCHSHPQNQRWRCVSGTPLSQGPSNTIDRTISDSDSIKYTVHVTFKILIYTIG